MNSRVKNGFTLIELMIVIVILGLLAALVVPNLISKSEQSKEKIACLNMKSLYNGPLSMFKLDNGSYPTTAQGLKALVKNPNPQMYPNYAKNGYLRGGKIPKDSWGHNFVYINNHGKVDLISLGANGKEGGSGDNADINLDTCK